MFGTPVMLTSSRWCRESASICTLLRSVLRIALRYPQHKPHRLRLQHERLPRRCIPHSLPSLVSTHPSERALDDWQSRRPAPTPPLAGPMFLGLLARARAWLGPRDLAPPVLLQALWPADPGPWARNRAWAAAHAHGTERRRSRAPGWGQLRVPPPSALQPPSDTGPW